MAKHKITGFVSAFEERLAKRVKRLKKLRKSAQWKNGEQAANKEEILKTLEEAKRLRALIRELREQDPGGNHRTIVCPSCGKKIKT